MFLWGTVVSGELTIKNIYGKVIDENYIKDARWIDRNEVKSLTVFPEIIKEAEFWESKEKNNYTRYLGRQEG